MKSSISVLHVQIWYEQGLYVTVGNHFTCKILFNSDTVIFMKLTCNRKIEKKGALLATSISWESFLQNLPSD